MVTRNERTRIVETREDTEILAVGEVGAGNACDEYEVTWHNPNGYMSGNTLHFQRGPIQIAGANGLQNEDLITVIIDRLKGFQDGPFKCRENAIAITKLEEALLWLEKRTSDRKKRGVEGKSEV